MMLKRMFFVPLLCLVISLCHWPAKVSAEIKAQFWPLIVQNSSRVASTASVRQGKSYTDTTTDSAEQLYKQALQALQLIADGTDFSHARQLFREFIHTYPQHPLSIDSMYWIGQTYYGDKQYENAILQFQDVIQKYANHPKMPAALTQQGMAFYALGDSLNAKVILERVVYWYPQTSEADKARELLVSWN